MWALSTLVRYKCICKWSLFLSYKFTYRYEYICRFKVPEGCTTELSAQATQFLTSLFERADVVRVYFVIGIVRYKELVYHEPTADDAEWLTLVINLVDAYTHGYSTRQVSRTRCLLVLCRTETSICRRASSPRSGAYVRERAQVRAPRRRRCSSGPRRARRSRRSWRVASARAAPRRWISSAVVLRSRPQSPPPAWPTARRSATSSSSASSPPTASASCPSTRS